MKDFNSNCIYSENAFSNTYNWQFGGEIFFLLSAFQEGCGLQNPSASKNRSY